MFVFSNLATSLDGKIATTSRVLFPLGTDEDRRQMDVLRRKCDAVLMGASTFRVFKKPCLILGASQHPINIILSSTLEGISPSWEFFRHPGLRRILFVSHLATTRKIKPFLKTSEVIQLKKPSRGRSVPQQVIQHLENHGVIRLLVEGGGNVMWDFVKDHLIDEFHVTLTPKIIGGSEAPTLVDGKGFSPKEVAELKLLEHRVVGDEIYLVYRKGS